MTAFREKAASLLRRAFPRRLAMAAVLLASFMIGYNALLSGNAQCLAQNPPFYATTTVTVAGGLCACCSPSACPVPCEPSGTASNAANRIYSSLYNALRTAAREMEQYLGDLVDGMVGSNISRIHTMEMNLVQWWDTMWYYNLRPSWQSLTDQLTTALADQARTFQSALDAEHEVQTSLEYQKNELESQRDYSGEVECGQSTAGGFGRAAEFARGMRQGWQNNAVAIMTNKPGTPGAGGQNQMSAYRNEVFENTFCDPSDNAGYNTCGATNPELYNADIDVAGTVYNNLTIPVDDPAKGDGYAQATQAIMYNLVGAPGAEPINPSAMGSAEGQHSWLSRRSYLARYAAIQSAPALVLSWRMPGSAMGEVAANLRKQTGLDDSKISQNPSYKELMHTLSVDRFNSGNYATRIFVSKNALEREKLALNTLYLMQLRDYHDLLERWALTLAVQLSMLSENMPLDEPPTSVRP